MAILQFPVAIPVTNGNLPTLKFMVTTDSLATLTAAGYLNSANTESAAPMSNTDVVMALYSYSTQTTIGTLGIFTVTITSGNITLTSWADTSNVTQPTAVNNIIVSTNTAGQLANLVGTAINSGSLQAGSSGIAGTLISYPATALKGSLIVAGVANTGNTTTTISNAAMGQASVISIPDPGTATADFALAPAALVNGNLVQASGTAGLLADSGISAASLATVVSTQTAIVTLNTGAVVGMYGTPQLIVAAPGAGFALMPIACQIITVVSTAFTAGGVAQLQWGNTVHAGGTIALDATTPTAEITAAASQIYTQYGVPTTKVTAIAVANNLGLYFTNATQAFATGTGSTVTLCVTYQIIPV